MNQIENIMQLADLYSVLFGRYRIELSALSLSEHQKARMALRDAIEQALAVQPEQEPVNLETIEQYRMQMAGISTAAFGYWKEGDGIHPDYDTVALRDVAKLYAKYDEFYKQVHAPQPQPKQEPVATKTERGITLHFGWDDLPTGAKLYTEPQPAEPAERKPLTDEELNAVFPAIATYHEANKTLYRSIARAVEAAHGIGETK